jgi:hypothetical protein
MTQFYYRVIFAFVLTSTLILPGTAISQVCGSLQASFTTTESRCAATGTISITATGGSGNYQYNASGPVNVNFTSSDVLSGLRAGSYVVRVKDIVTNCIFSQANVMVSGSYSAPNFTMVPEGVTCRNGNDGKITVTGQTNGRGPFSYRIIAPSASAVGTINASGVFTGLLSGNYLVQLRDSCGGIQTRSVNVENYEWNINSSNVAKIDCDSVSVILGLIDSKFNTSPHAIFNAFSYGVSAVPGDTAWFSARSFQYYKGTRHSLSLLAKDGCGNIKSVLWTEPLPAAASLVNLTNRACNTITASVTGQQNLTAPQYCIYDTDSIEIACNTTGIFAALPYGSYCIKIKDTCYDTTITRCFTAYRPAPSVSGTVGIVTGCNAVNATITGQTNLNNPNYCLYDENNVSLGCNGTGVFTGIPYGTYCIKIENDSSCYDTVIVRCFTIYKPAPTGNLTITNQACSTFTVTVTDTAHWNNPQFCLFTASHVPIICNSTGIFTNLPYGTYCIDIINGAGCYDTTITRCFTVTRPLVSLGNTVTISNKNCSGFTASVTGQTNLSDPRYLLLDTLSAVLDSNLTGIFTNMPYGSYCIRTINNAACFDTTFERCFNVDAIPAIVTLTSSRSCAIFRSNITVTINSGNVPFSLSLFTPGGVLLSTAANVNSYTYTFTNLPDLPLSKKYVIVATDACGNSVTDSIAAYISKIHRTFTHTARCPSTLNPLGSKDVVLELTDTDISGTVDAAIIKKNGVATNIAASSQFNNRIFTFLELAPGTYIFDTYQYDCAQHFYDTVVVKPYLFPDLSGTRAYQCDIAGFSVNVTPANGMAPYTYEIFGSLPATPSITTAPQANSVFLVSNNTAYSLIRLRAVDACGNADLYDASVLPMANFVVYPDRTECFNQPLTLTVDSTVAGDYKWYKRVSGNDSVLVGNGPNYTIPLLNIGDTGRYFCRIVMNYGCLIKNANYILTGFCGGVLPVEVQLAGKKQNDGNKLSWPSSGTDVKEYVLERKSGNSNYQPVSVIPKNNGNAYSFLDKTPADGNNFYRLQIKGPDNQIKYSNEVLIKNSSSGISFYPNPVQNTLNISVGNSINKTWLIEVSSISGQKMISKKFVSGQNRLISIPRGSDMASGVYLLTVTQEGSSERNAFKVIYQ